MVTFCVTKNHINVLTNDWEVFDAIIVASTGKSGDTDIHVYVFESAGNSFEQP